MPVMNGLKLVQALRAMEFTGTVIVMSGSLVMEDIDKYRRLAIEHFLSKPFEISQVVAALDAAPTQIEP